MQKLIGSPSSVVRWRKRYFSVAGYRYCVWGYTQEIKNKKETIPVKDILNRHLILNG